MLIQLLYIGITKDQNNYFDVWATFTENNGQPFVQNITYNFKVENRLTDAVPGQIFQFNYHNNNQTINIVSKSAEYLGVWQNNEDIARWQSAHKAVNSVYCQKLMQEKDKDVKFDFEILQPFREAFLSLSDKETKEMFLAQLICFITRPKKN